MASFPVNEVLVMLNLIVVSLVFAVGHLVLGAVVAHCLISVARRLS